MNINGRYKISIEMSARKQVDGLLATTNRLLHIVGKQGTPEPHEKEAHIQQVINMFKENQNIIDSFDMNIDDEKIVVTTDEGSLVYDIKKKICNDSNGEVRLELDCEEIGPIIWDVRLINGYFLFDSEDGLSEYVFQRQ